LKRFTASPRWFLLPAKQEVMTASVRPSETSVPDEPQKRSKGDR
jgi:hypothetical protein